MESSENSGLNKIAKAFFSDYLSSRKLEKTDILGIWKKLLDFSSYIAEPTEKVKFLRILIASIKRELDFLKVEEWEEPQGLVYDRASPTSADIMQLYESLVFLINQHLMGLPAVVPHNDTIPTSEKKRVFLCYSRKDKKARNRIALHFKPFKKELEYFDDTQIGVGEDWKKRIEYEIDNSTVAIFLVSPDFLASDFINGEELPRILKKAEAEGTVILILIYRPCLFEAFEPLAKYQTMNPPSRPLSLMQEDERELVYVNLVRQVKQLFNPK